MRIRRLNRSRLKKAKELKDNRKAIKKLPYMVLVDNIGRAQGIHKHIWWSAVRGQCGRLDWAMDNINHHPKYVVDSIWRALETKWKFQDFVYRLREMFKKCATKFMRNKKMQLKCKCQRSHKGKKLEDIKPCHWVNIEKVSKTSPKENNMSTSKHATVKEKEIVPDNEVEVHQTPLLIQVTMFFFDEVRIGESGLSGKLYSCCKTHFHMCTKDIYKSKSCNLCTLM